MTLSLDRAGVDRAGSRGKEGAAFGEFSLTITAGERVGIIGAEGAGKSTLLAILAGLLRPVRGRLLLDGVDLHASPAGLRKFRRGCGVAFQFPEQFFVCRTVEEEILFGARSLGRPAVLSGEEALTACGLPPGDLLGRSPWTLSAGEARRVAIAALLPAAPSLVLLDEPTAGLDAPGRRALLHLITEGRLRGMTLVVASHDRDFLQAVAGRVLRLEQGTVAGDGAAGEMLRGGEVPAPWRAVRRR